MVNEVRASHILVSTKQEANNLINQIRSGASFEKLAQQHSQCPSGKNGGDLGFFGLGQMVPAFETAAFTMEPGQVSQPVQTQFGYHIIKVTGKR
jgi:parvulin-like peptidyl-prolyl isomerase